jgi:nucleoside permease NupC
VAGFANFPSIAFKSAESKHSPPCDGKTLARLGLKSMIAGLLACYLFEAVVAVLI